MAASWLRSAITRPGLHPSPGAVGGHLEDPVHVAGEVHLDAGAHGSPGQTGAHTAAYQGQSVLRRVLDQADHVLARRAAKPRPSGVTWLSPASVA